VDTEYFQHLDDGAFIFTAERPISSRKNPANSSEEFDQRTGHVQAKVRNLSSCTRYLRSWRSWSRAHLLLAQQTVSWKTRDEPVKMRLESKASKTANQMF